ncbi:hypothetical protein L7F22_025295 [Adiantum nelumboides]|nr:hypothetical protein [Adiantum nelumboides]
MQHLSSKERSVFDSKAAKTPSSPAKGLGSQIPWHGRPASPARAQEEAIREASFEPQRPQTGARKWTLSPLNHARSLDIATRPSGCGLHNTSPVQSFPPGSNRNVMSLSNSLTSSSSLGCSEVSDNDVRNLTTASGTSSGSSQLPPRTIGRLWEEAITSQKTQSVLQLLKCGFDVCGDGVEMQRPPLILAVLTGNTALVKLLLTAGADINCIDNNGFTALHHAAAAGDRSLVKLLLVTGADLYARTKEGLFPMHLATDGPTCQLLSQRLKADTQNSTHFWMGLPHESSSGAMVQVDSLSLSAFLQMNTQTQENASTSSEETHITCDSSDQGPKRGPMFFRHGSLGQSDFEDGLNNKFLQDCRFSVPSSSNEDFDAKLVKGAEKDFKDNWISSFIDKNAHNNAKQFLGSQNVWLQNPISDKTNSQDSAKAATLHNGLNPSGGANNDGKDAIKKTLKGSPQECSGNLSTSSFSPLAAGKLESQQGDLRTDNKLLNKSVQGLREGLEPMMDGRFKAQEDFLCARNASCMTDDQATSAAEQVSPARSESELSSSASNSFNSLSCPAQTKVKPVIMSCNTSPGESFYQKQKAEGECVMPENKGTLKDSDHNLGNALNCDVLSDKGEEFGCSIQGTTKQEETSKLFSAEHDDSQMQGKEKKQVKFVAPSEADLALVRKDWHNAARAGCVGCGTEGCGGKCLPKQPHGDAEPSTTASSSKSKKCFKKTQMKQTKNFEWKRGELLGEGAYGKVFCGLNQSTGELMAVKQLKFHNMNNDEEKAFNMACLEREISLYKEMRHKHIVSYIDMDKDEEAGYLYIFLEYVSGGSIQSMLERFGPFSEPLVRVYTRQLLLGLEYLHKNRIVHRDIKGGNVLVDSDGVVKLADFGASKAFHEATVTDACKSIRGSVFWMAPEVIKGDNYGRHADIWSVGCTVIEMLTAMHPWPAIDNSWAAIFQIAKASSGPPIPETVSNGAKDFLRDCFHLNPKIRPSASQLLAHPFVAKAPELDRKVVF